MRKNNNFLVWSWIWFGFVVRSIRLVCCRYLTASHCSASVLPRFGVVGVVSNISMCWKQWFCLYIKTSKQRFDAVKTELPLIPLQIRKLFCLFFGLFFVILPLFLDCTLSSIPCIYVKHLLKYQKWWNFTYFLSSRADHRIFHSFSEFSFAVTFLLFSTRSTFFFTETFVMDAQMC